MCTLKRANLSLQLVQEQIEIFYSNFDFPAATSMVNLPPIVMMQSMERDVFQPQIYKDIRLCGLHIKCGNHRHCYTCNNFFRRHLVPKQPYICDTAFPEVKSWLKSCWTLFRAGYILIKILPLYVFSN